MMLKSDSLRRSGGQGGFFNSSPIGLSISAFCIKSSDLDWSLPYIEAEKSDQNERF
jgi:hypothetical protein